MNAVNFYLLTDTHYFATTLSAEGKAYEEYMTGELFFLRESSSIVKSVFNDISKDNDTNIVIIPGDLSKNGELESHKEFIAELNKLKASGKKIFVITAGHDFGEWSNSYKGDEIIRVEGTPFEELYNLYFDFGFKDALSVEMRTNSYVAEIAGGVRLLALNCDSCGKPKGVIDEETLRWAKEQIEKSKADNAFMFAICHYPIIPPVEIFDFIKDTRVENWREIATFLADNGVELAFTGHMHIQSINEFVTEKGNRLIDVCTSVLVGSPAKYRKVTIDENARLKIESLDVKNTGCDMHGLSIEEFFDRRCKAGIRGKIEHALNGDKFIKKFVKKIVFSIKVGTLSKLLFIKVDKSLKDRKLIDLAVEVAANIFAGDPPYTKGTPVYDALDKALLRLNFIIKKLNKKLSKDGNEVELRKMVLNTVGNSKGYSDHNFETKLNLN